MATLDRYLPPAPDAWRYFTYEAPDGWRWGAWCPWNRCIYDLERLVQERRGGFWR